MSRFNDQQKAAIYRSSYTLPRLVTMILDPGGTSEKSVMLFPATKITPTGATHRIHNQVKWVQVEAHLWPANESYNGWIPKSVLHDFAYAELLNKGAAAAEKYRATGATYGGDKVDYDTNKLTARLEANLDRSLSSRCDFCGNSLNSHKMPEDEDVIQAMDKLFELLATGVGKNPRPWELTAGDHGKKMIGICRLSANKYIAAFSGESTDESLFNHAVADRLAASRSQKGKWTIAAKIPAETQQINTRTGTLSLAQLCDIWKETMRRVPGSLSELSCAAPRLLYQAYLNDRPEIEAFTERWFEPTNSNQFLGNKRIHNQTVPSCTRCSTVVRLMRCPRVTVRAVRD